MFEFYNFFFIKKCKVHASPYRYHAAYIGACVLSNSATYDKSRLSREEWRKNGAESVRKWIKS